MSIKDKLAEMGKEKEEERTEEEKAEDVSDRHAEKKCENSDRRNPFNRAATKKHGHPVVEYSKDPLFDRQERIDDWDQQALLNTRVAILGSNIMTAYLVSCLSALGLGNIYIIDDKKKYESEEAEDKKNFLLSLSQSNSMNSDRCKSRAYALETAVREELDPSRYVHIRSIIGNYHCLKLVPSIDIIIDATNNPGSKIACRKYADDNLIPMISLCCDAKNSYTEIYNPNIKAMEKNRMKNGSSITKKLSIAQCEIGKNPDFAIGASETGGASEADACASENPSDTLDAVVLKYFDKKKQHPLTAAISAGMAIDFARKCALNLKSDPKQKRIHSILYTFESKKRLFYDEECRDALHASLYASIEKGRKEERKEKGGNEEGNVCADFQADSQLVYIQSLKKEYYKKEGCSRKDSTESDCAGTIDKKVLIAGAGAIGNFAALQLALLGVKNIDIVDMDTVEITNANRQILICDRDSKERQRKKAEVLSEKIKRINSEINVRGIYGRISEEVPDLLSGLKKLLIKRADNINEQFLINNKYDAIIGCLDNPQARALLNRWAVELKIPYIDGGTDAFNACVRTYIPRETGCMECQMNISKLAEEWDEKNRQTESCELNTKEPSIVTSNLISGSVIAGEAYAILTNEKAFPAAKNSISYSSSHNPEMSVSPAAEKPRNSCRCNPGSSAVQTAETIQSAGTE